jgi:hypothetical protein
LLIVANTGEAPEADVTFPGALAVPVDIEAEIAVCARRCAECGDVRPRQSADTVAHAAYHVSGCVRS